MLKTCNQCHSLNFAKSELAKGDSMIREADRLMAEGDPRRCRTLPGRHPEKAQTIMPSRFRTSSRSMTPRPSSNRSSS